MTDFFQQVRDFFDKFGFFLCISLFAGAAYAAQIREKTVYGYICALTVAGFTGLLTGLALTELSQFISISPGLQGFVVGVASFSGGETLSRWADRLGIIMDFVFGTKKKD